MKRKIVKVKVLTSTTQTVSFEAKKAVQHFQSLPRESMLEVEGQGSMVTVGFYSNTLHKIYAYHDL